MQCQYSLKFRFSFSQINEWAASDLKPVLLRELRTYHYRSWRIYVKISFANRLVATTETCQDTPLHGHEVGHEPYNHMASRR